GQLLTQMCKNLGATVYTVVSTEAKRKIALDAGADEVFDYDNFGEKLRDVTQGVGVDVAYDAVGADTFDTSLASVRTRGMIVLFGAASGPVPPFDLQRLNAAGALFTTRPSLAHYTLTGDEVSWRAGDIFGWLAEGAAQLSVAQRVALLHTAAPLRASVSRATAGKTVLIPHPWRPLRHSHHRRTDNADDDAQRDHRGGSLLPSSASPVARARRYRIFQFP